MAVKFRSQDDPSERWLGVQLKDDGNGRDVNIIVGGRFVAYFSGGDGKLHLLSSVDLPIDLDPQGRIKVAQH